MNSNAVLERHPDLYFQDGDIVLAVKQTIATGSTDDRTKYTVFRIHRFLLKHHSTVFANFFSDANAAPAENYDGVPLAEMHGDKAEDFALLLGYLYNPSSLIFKRNDPNVPLTVAGVVRLADKYLIEPLHRRLVQQVCEDWPTTLSDYDIRQGKIDVLRKAATSNVPIQYGADPDHKERLSDIIPEPASAILFAREFQCPQILPAAFYALSLIPVANDWSRKLTYSRLARWSILDGESLLRCMQGCQALRRYHPFVPQFLSETCESTWEFESSDTPCSRFITRLFAVTFKEGSTAVTHRDPLRLLDRCSRYREIPELSHEQCPDRLCEDCRVEIGGKLAEERKKIWEELSKYFGLD